MPAAKEEQSAGDWWANVLGCIFLVLCILSFIAQNWVYFIVPFALAAAGFAAYLHFSSNAYHVKTAWQKAKIEYDSLALKYASVTCCPPEKVKDIVTKFFARDDANLSLSSYKWTIAAITDIYRWDYNGKPFPEFPSLDSTRDAWHVEGIVKEAREVLEYAEQEVSRVSLTMDFVVDVIEPLLSFNTAQSDSGPLVIRTLDAIPDIRDIITSMSACFFLPKYWDVGVGESVRNRYLDNLGNAITKSKGDHDERDGNVVPSEFVGSNQDVVDAYLGRTPFLEPFTDAVPYRFSQRLRYEHGVIVAGTGGGKTQLLEALVLADLDEEDPPGLIVIDSKGEMVERIAHLDLFHPDHGRLRDRLIIINHDDNPSLNLLDVDEEVIEKQFNRIEELMKYFFGTLFDSKMSDQMETLFISLLHIAVRKDGATVQTLIDLVRNPRLYPDVLDRIPDGPKDFILNHYNDSFYALTKSAIITRLSRLTVDTSLRALFTSPRNAIDLAQALNDGKIVLVNTDLDGLGEERSKIFGRYFIAQSYNAGLARGSRQSAKRRPIHVYIDECAPYLDHKIEKMLTTIRSYGVGMMMAFQGEWQMTGYQRVIQGNTSIKMLGHLRDEGDAKMFATNMRTSPEFLLSLGKDPSEPPEYADFGCYTTELKRTVMMRVPFYQLDQREPMSEATYRRLKANNLEQVTKGRVTGADGQSEHQPRQVAEPSMAENVGKEIQETLEAQAPIVMGVWSRFEGVCIGAGGYRWIEVRGEPVKQCDIDKLLTLELLSQSQARRLNLLRGQRNKVSHHPPVLIPNIAWWQMEMEAVIEILSKYQTDDSTGTTPDFS